MFLEWANIPVTSLLQLRLFTYFQDVHGEMETIFLTRETDSRIENVDKHFKIYLFNITNLKAISSV